MYRLYGRHDEVVAEYVRDDARPYEAALATCTQALATAIADPRTTEDQRHDLEQVAAWTVYVDPKAELPPVPIRLSRR